MTRIDTGSTRGRVEPLPVGEPAPIRVQGSPASIVLAPSRSLSRTGRARCATAALCISPLAAGAQIANSEALVDLVARPGGAGVGVLFSSERSPYRGDGQRSDAQPVYLYEGERFFLRSDRVGLKFVPFEDLGLETYLRRRIEGFPLDDAPPSLQGMKPRRGGVDLGLTWRLHALDSQAYASVTQNLGHQARGHDLGLGAHTDWHAGRWIVRPAASVTWRSSRSNDFYVGVPPDEATPERPVYEPGAGVDVSAGMFVSYRLTQGWRLIGGVNATRYSSAVRASPIAEPGTQVGVVAGATYSLGADRVREQVATSPTWVRLLYGRAAEDRCDIVLIATLRCTSINGVAPTEIIGLTVGKTLLENLNDWPLDIVGYAGFIVHHDRPFQRDGAELNLFLKAFFR
ncbi:MAG TPA: MipA/OmpV family protein, partial [Burkholderiaceae bacterium]|nr:MipA/OmpV family protein [Burkholderiaceae bacterium]